MYNDEMFSGEIGQVGSQFDGLGHIGILIGNQTRYYNGLTQDQVGGGYGLKKLGVHNVKPFFTRGILLDILALKGGERLPIGYVITVDDIKQALTKQNVKEPGEGDVVLFRTGHIKLWKKDNAEYNKGHAGPGETAAHWLVERKIACVGADTWAVEAVPGENEKKPFICHAILITMNGIHIIENQYLEELAQDRVYEFAWSFNPCPLWVPPAHLATLWRWRSGRASEGMTRDNGGACMAQPITRQISSTCSIPRRPAPVLTYENLANTTARISPAPAWSRAGNWNFGCGVWCRTRALGRRLRRRWTTGEARCSHPGAHGL